MKTPLLILNLIKEADLLSSVELQPHQKDLIDESANSPKKLLYHALGSGKTLSSIGMAEARNKPYVAVTPASLRANFRGEQAKFTDQTVPSDVMSYTALAAGQQPKVDPHTVIFDEAHRLRNQNSKQTQQAIQLASKAKQLTLLSGSPVVNAPDDLASQITMLTGNKMTSEQFNNRFVGKKTVGPGFWGWLRGVKPTTEPVAQNTREFKELFKGKVDYYAPHDNDVDVKREDHHSEFTADQANIYKAMMDELPWLIKWKMANDYPMNSGELQKAVSFLTGPRQLGLSVYPYMKRKDPLVAFHSSPKLMQAHQKLTEHLRDPRKKALIFSNFIGAGLEPYSAKLTEQGIPHGVFHGGLNDVQRKQLVEDFNNDKLRAVLLGPSGSEGVSFRGTTLVQLLDPAWNQTRENQSEGRSIRFDSHTGMPEDLKNVTMQRFVSRLPEGFLSRLLGKIGLGGGEAKSYASDDYLRQMSARKQKLNDQFLNLLKEVGTRK